jgi:sulfopyruvate decarboxylase subunit beta
MATMRKHDAIAQIIDAFPATPVVFSTGYISRLAYHVRDTPNHFYMVGSMGLAASIGIGISTITERQVVVVDGDGSLLMGLNGLLLKDELESACGIVHIVLNDGEYDSTGGQSAPPSTSRISDLARAAGYAQVHEADDATTLGVALLAVTDADTQGSVMVHCQITPSHAVPPRIDIELPDIFTRLRRYLTGDLDAVSGEASYMAIPKWTPHETVDR